MNSLHSRLCTLFQRDTVLDRAYSVVDPQSQQRGLKVVVLDMELVRGGRPGNYWFEIDLYDSAPFRVGAATQLDSVTAQRLNDALRANNA